MTDPHIDELLADLDRAVAIEPSPSVAARVRTAVARDTGTRWLGWPSWAVAVGAAALLVGWAIVRPRVNTLPISSPLPATAAAVKPSAPVAIPASRVSEVRPIAHRDNSGAEPEVIVSPGQRVALDQLAAAVRDGRITSDSFPAEGPPRSLDVVTITPITLDVVKIQVAPAGGNSGGVIREPHAPASLTRHRSGIVF